MKRRSNSEIAVLERYSIALDNAVSQPDIAKALQEQGYNKNVMAEGKAIWQTTRTTFDQHKNEADEAKQSYADYNNKRDELDELYRVHRKKAKVVFRKDKIILEKLLLNGSIPSAYIKWLELIKPFYSTIAGEKTIQQQLNRLKLTTEEVTKGIKLIAELENSRKEYMIEKGESEVATKLKEDAFDNIDDWMTDFFAVARIALDDQPQFLEVLDTAVES